MVAGSPGKRVQIHGGRLQPLGYPLDLTRGAKWALRRTATWQVFLALYIMAALALLAPHLFGTHPDWAYNWEGYTAWRWVTFWGAPAGPTWDILAPTDGLMTDSGQGPLVGLPISLGIALAGFTLEAMRLPVALVAALAPPLLWLCGRRMVGQGPSALAALLLAISPAFLFYGRTATLVGVSLAPLLLTTLALVNVLDAPQNESRNGPRGVFLAGSLLLGIFAYAPVRLLWPIVLAVLVLAALLNSRRRRFLAMTALGCLIAVPAGMMALEQLAAPEPDPVAAALGYFHARGEQLVAMGEDVAATGQYVRDFGRSSEPASADGWAAARQLVIQNGTDLGRLLLDRDTLSIGNDYWNERGRFWPWFLFPCALIGMLSVVSRARSLGSDTLLRLLPLLLVIGMALPLLLTSRVHVGRLLPVLPFALLLAASGLWACGRWLTESAPRPEMGGFWATSMAPLLLASGLLLTMMASSRAELALPMTITREARTVANLTAWADQLRERGGGVLIEDPGLGDEIEQVHAATYRLALSGTIGFADLTAGDGRREPDGLPVLYWRDALGALASGEIANPCHRLWFVTPESIDEFFTIWASTGCVGPPDSVLLP